MSKPESIKNDPWTSFPNQSDSIYSDDFCHEKLFVLKGQTKNSTAAINFKYSLSKGESFSIADDTKFWFGLPNSNTVFGKIKSNNYLKLIYDFGVKQIHGKKWNFYAGVNSNKALKNVSYRLGAMHLGQKCNTDNRLKYDNFDRNSLYWYNRTVITEKKFSFGLLGVLNLSNRVLQKSDAFFSYDINEKNNLLIKAQTQGWRKQNPGWNNLQRVFNTVSASYVSQIKPNMKVGAELVVGTEGEKFKSAQAVFEANCPENQTTFKFKVNNSTDLTLLWKRPVPKHEKLATFLVGASLRNAIKEDRSFAYGFQLNLNL